MIQLILNNTEVFPERDTSIKMIRENPVLTESGSYTLDVNLPLSITENVKFFGNLNRIEVSKKYQRYDCELRTNGRPLLVGTAVITKVTDQAVTIQILAGNSNVRFWNNAEGDYIDELDYNTTPEGDIVTRRMWGLYDGVLHKDETYKEGGDTGDMYFTYWLKNVHGLNKITRENFSGYFRGSRGEFCFCRVFDKSIDEGLQLRLPTFGNGERINSVSDGRLTDLMMYFNCIQPNLLWVVGKVCEKRGYTFDGSLLKGTPAENIYVASARQTLKIADALPHWTVKQFMEEIQHLFNVTIFFDDALMTARMVGNETIGSLYTISAVIDELEVDVKEEEEKRVDKVKYKSWEDDFHLILPAEVKKKNQVLLKGDKPVWQEIMSYSDAIKNDSIFITSEGRSYLYRKDAWYEKDHAMEVDLLGNKIIEEDQATELKIRPAKTVQKKYRDSYFEQRREGIGPFGFRDSLEVFSYYHSETVLEMENSWGGYTKVDGNLYDKLIRGEEITNSGKEDEMQLFFYNGDVVSPQDDYIYQYWEVDSGTRDGELKTENHYTKEGTKWFLPVSEPHHGRELRYSPSTYGYSLALKSFEEDSWNIGHRFKSRLEYQMKVEHKITFLSQSIPDVRSKFLIRGKLFACKKIEVNVSDDGIDPLLTGYFVEIKS